MNEMSLISNRKRPRGFSEAFDTTSDNSSGNKTKTTNGYFDTNSSSSGSTYNDISPSGGNNLNLNLNINLNESDTTINTHDSTTKKVNFGMNGAENAVIEDLDSECDEDDDVIILEERQITRTKSKRNNSDSVLTYTDAFAAYNMFNVNNTDNFEISENNYMTANTTKKQRTNSLPQLPQVKCFYNKPVNYVLQYPKLGNIRADVIPHQMNLPPCDDKDGHYIIKINDLFANRFVILRLLGQGTFGKVVECYDKVNRETVAIKIIRNIPKYRDAAKIELRILSTLKKFDNQNDNHCIHLRECFDFRGHICIVTDLLQISLYDFLERNKYIAFPGSHIQAISKQLIRSVTFLHDLSLIHTDLKPENILLHDDTFNKKLLRSNTILSSYINLTKINETSSKKLPKYSKILKNPLIQIIDFGSAIFDDEYHSSIVSTRHYRAPEIVLGVGWSFPCDMWSVGCILVELVIGEPLFKTHDNLEHLAMIEKVCGRRIDKSMVLLSKAKENECGSQYFTEEYNGFSDEESERDDVIIDDELNRGHSLSLIFPTDTTPQKFINSVDQLARIDLFISSRIGLNIDLDYSLSKNFDKNKHLINFGNFTFWWFFIDLLKNLLIINPEERLTALEALEHPWFNLGIEDEGTVG